MGLMSGLPNTTVLNRYLVRDDKAMTHKNFDMIDVFKFVLAVFVVSVHTHATGFDWVGKIAVPFFFIVSGVLFFRKAGLRPSAIDVAKYSKRIGIIYVVWILFYMPFYVTKPVSISGVMLAFLTGHIPGFAPAWYLPASIIGMWFTVYLAKLVRLQGVLVIGGVIELFLIWLTSYPVGAPGWLLMISDYIVLSPLRSMLYFGIGLTIATLADKAPVIGLWQILVVGVLFLGEQIVQHTNTLALATVGTRQESVMLPIVATLLVIYGFQSSVSVPFARMFRDISTYVYLSHVWIIHCINAVDVDYRGLPVPLTLWIVVTLVAFGGYAVARKTKLPLVI